MKKKGDKTHKNNTGAQDNFNRRKRTEEELRHEEQLFLSLAEQSLDIIILLNREGVITYINPAIERHLGFKEEEMIGSIKFELIHPDDLKSVTDKFNTLLRNINSSVTRTEVRIRHKNGSWRTFKTIGSNLVRDNVIEATIVNLYDITERKLVEEKLRESEANYRQLFDNSPAAIYQFDFKKGKFLKANDLFCEYFGCSQEEITSLNPYDILTEESKKLFWERMEKISQGLKVPEIVEYEVLDKKGKRWVLQLHNKNIYDAEGNLVASDVVAHDITERRQIENELRASESNFRHSLDKSPLGVRISTVEAKTIYANRAILDIYGYDSIEELQNTSLKERYTPESYAEWEARKKKRLQGEFGPSEYEISIIRKNGEIRHLHVFRKEIFWDGKRQSQVIYQDITLRRQAEKKLSATLENLRQSISTTIQVLGMASEARDPYTAGHQKRVSHLARFIAKDMGLSHDIIEGIRMASSIHDIGKLSVPSEILTKPTRLTDLEFSLIKEHAQNGYEMLKNVESPWPLAEIVLQHHERINGTGYPRNLKVDNILMAARIMAVADVVEAMSSHRPYRASLGIDAALEEIEKNKGILYDETVVDACLRLFREKGYKLI